jgi:hypothetical protein
MHIHEVAALRTAAVDQVRSAPVSNIRVLPIIIACFLDASDLQQVQVMVGNVLQSNGRLRGRSPGKRARKVRHCVSSFSVVGFFTKDPHHHEARDVGHRNGSEASAESHPEPRSGRARSLRNQNELKKDFILLRTLHSRFFGGAFVSSEQRTRVEMPAIHRQPGTNLRLLRRFVKTADSSHELERSSSNLFGIDGRINVEIRSTGPQQWRINLKAD